MSALTEALDRIHLSSLIKESLATQKQSHERSGGEIRRR